MIQALPIASSVYCVPSNMRTKKADNWYTYVGILTRRKKTHVTYRNNFDTSQRTFAVKRTTIFHNACGTSSVRRVRTHHIGLEHGMPWYGIGILWILDAACALSCGRAPQFSRLATGFIVVYIVRMRAKDGMSCALQPQTRWLPINSLWNPVRSV